MMKPPQVCLLNANSGPRIGITGTPGNWTIGTSYTFTPSIAGSHGGGTSPYVWSITAGTLPGWASLDTSTGAITGTPTDSADFTVTLHVVDAASLIADRTYTFIQHDASFSSIKALLHLDGANNGTTFTDVTGRAWTAVSGAKLTTTSPKFGTACLTVNGSGDYISAVSSSDFAFGTADFTVECWVKIAAGQTGDHGIICVGVSSGLGFGITGSGGTQGCLFAGPTGVAYGAVGTVAVPTATWTHIACSRQGTTMRIFVNGAISATATDSTNYQQGIMVAGASYLGFATAFLNGQIDDMRVTKGVARYTAAFTATGFPFPNQ